MVIDFHAHILPGIDDGAKDLETSIEMLDKMKKQGVDLVVATPHFYADRMTVDGFLKNREKAYEAVESRRRDGWPKVMKGAEVAFFPGISKAGRVRELAIEAESAEPSAKGGSAAAGSGDESPPGRGAALLLEMPFRDWDRSVEQETVSLARGGLLVILAHIERFMSPANEKAIERLLSEPNIKAQANVNSLADRRLGRKLVPLFADGKARFIGSDCHGVRHRPPNLPDGRKALLSALGVDFMAGFDEDNEKFLEELCRKKQA